ncbi:MAG: disulfide bond formation protein B [Betaproteobacteria bacterium]|nr:disulfide bond formation protein B [Betaproteobacteria bacterium]
MFSVGDFINPRGMFALMFLACAGLMGFGLYLQHAMNLEPCPLCILQRYAFIATGIVALMAALHNPQVWGRVLYALLVVLFSGAGAGVAGRQVWLQHNPPVTAGCGPGLEYMLESFPLSQVLPLLFKGEGDCAKVVWQFLGLSIPEWALICFVLLILAAAWAAFYRRR